MKKLLLYTIPVFAALGLNAQNIPTGAYSTSGSQTNSYSVPGGFTSGLLNVSRVWVPHIRITDANSAKFTLSPALFNYDVSAATTYYNGWGKSIESIKRGYAGSHTRDIVTLYDNRVSDTTISLLPYNVATVSQFQANGFSAQKSYYQGLFPNEGNTAAGESIVSYPSTIPTVTTYLPGKGLLGQARGTVVQTITNGNNEVADYEYEGNGTINNLGTYPVNSLMVKVTTTANGGVSREYIDANGHTICKMVQVTNANNNTSYLCTYYVYDEAGRLGMIIPPKVIATNATDYAQSCYWYDYDAYNNIIRRHVPDQNGIYNAVYDGNHRMVLMSSPLMAMRHQYAFDIYDGAGRVVISGIYTDVTSPDDLQTAIYHPATAPAPGSLMYYLVNGFTGTYPSAIPNCEIDRINYYDQYPTGDPQLSGRTFDNSYASSYISGPDIPVPFMFPEGLLTASRTRVKDSTNSLPNEWVCDVYFYDHKGQLIQTQTLNPWNTSNWDVSTNEYNFDGKPLVNIMRYYDKNSSNKPTIKVVKASNYDYYNDNRLTGVTLSIDNNTSRSLAEYKYDSLGRVYNKYIGGVENQYYDYNIRGELTGINSDYVRSGCGTWIPDVTFGSALYYEYGFSNPRFDDKISGRIWREAGSTNGAPVEKAYGYGYDQAGRMTNAEFREYSDGVTDWYPCGANMGICSWNKSMEDYTVSNVTYDQNGNILTTGRRGTVPGGPVDIDNLTFQYNGNQLNGVKDAIDTNYHLGDFQDGNNCTSIIYINGQPVEVTNANCQDYAYDADGNLSMDLNKNIQSIYCNEADQPLKITFGNGGTITNIYDASGALVQKTISDPANNVNDVYRYWGPFTYRNDSLLYILNDEGRVRWVADSNLYRFDYFIKDDQGNVRTVVTADAPAGQSYLGTYEVARANIENTIFNNVASVSTVKPGSTNPGDIEAARLNGADSTRRIGTSLMLQVMAGDKIDLSTDYYYEADTSDERTYATTSAVLQSLFHALVSGGTTTATGESNTTYLQAAYKSLSANTAAVQALMDNATDPSAPRAYINYLVFDDKMNLIPAESGSIQVGAIQGTWTPSPNQPPVKIGHNGYVLVFQSDPQYKNVYMDNFNIYLYQGKLQQQQQYYPFGLTVNEGQLSNTEPNKFLYEGKEYHNELGYDLYDFQARQYDPQLGRFWGIDPANQYPSGYTGMGNDPANLVDPTGMLTGGAQQYSGGGSTMPAQTRPADFPQEGDYDGYYGNGGHDWETMYEANAADQESSDDKSSSGAADATDGGSNPDPTDVYTSQGQYVTHVEDGTDNVYVINPGSEGLFYSATAQTLLSGTSIDLTSSSFAGIGINYDVAAFSNFYTNYGNSVSATKLDNTSLDDAHSFQFNGEPISPKAEVIANLVLKNNVVTVGNAHTSDGDMVRSYSQDLSKEANTVGSIHTHPFSTDGDINSVKYHSSGPGGHVWGGVSPGDYKGVSEFTIYRNIAVDRNYIYMYNNNSEQTIRIKR